MPKSRTIGGQVNLTKRVVTNSTSKNCANLTSITSIKNIKKIPVNIIGVIRIVANMQFIQSGENN